MSSNSVGNHILDIETNVMFYTLPTIFQRLPSSVDYKSTLPKPANPTNTPYAVKRDMSDTPTRSMSPKLLIGGVLAEYVHLID